MTRRLAVIPARGGSKRIPDKNIREFGGRPMIGHILDAASQSGLFDAIHVSTECERIAQVAERLGYPVRFMRPGDLADDHTPLMPVLRHVVETFAREGDSFDQVWLLMACAPLIEPSDLVEASELFSAKSRPVVSVAKYPVPIEWAFRRRSDGSLDPLHPEMMVVRSQDIPDAYYDTGSFYIYPSAAVMQSTGAGDYSSYVGYPLPRSKAVDIDTLDDWHFAELAYSAQNASSKQRQD